MAQADSFLVNDNATTKDTQIIDLFTDPHIFNNLIIRNKSTLESSATEIDIDPRYNYRPDRLAYEYYGQDFWYPAILAVNNMGSMIQFKAETLNFKCKIPNIDVLKSILREQTTETITVDSIVDSIFKS